MATAPKAVTHARPKAKDDKKDGKEKAIVYPSDFGSHAGMVNADLTGKIPEGKQDAANPWVILTDQRGDYATRKSHLDSGMADPNRFADQPAREQSLKTLTAA